MSSLSLRALILALLAFGATGCIGDAEVDADPDVEQELEAVPEDVWVLAPAGCEGVSLEGLTRTPVQGAPGLGALVAHGPDGRRVVRCVDSSEALRIDREVLALAETALLANDPSPQPSVDEQRYGTEAHGAQTNASETNGTEPDPTPTPLTEEDPTPTPMSEGSESDSTPSQTQSIWLVYSDCEGGVHGDPTPTPMTNPSDDDGTDEDPTPTPMLPVWGAPPA